MWTNCLLHACRCIIVRFSSSFCATKCWRTRDSGASSSLMISTNCSRSRRRMWKAAQRLQLSSLELALRLVTAVNCCSYIAVSSLWIMRIVEMEESRSPDKILEKWCKNQSNFNQSLLTQLILKSKSMKILFSFK